MRFADCRDATARFVYWLHPWPRRYGFALAAVVAAAWLRHGLNVSTGFAQPFVLFYPALVLVALLAGPMPGLAATLLALAIAKFFFIPPVHSFALSSPREIVRLVLFAVIGIAISGLGQVFRRHSRRLEEFEKAMEGLEEMIAVVDRDYRIVIANRAFLNYRGMKREDVVGRRVPEIVNSGTFEETVKEKLDECFQGKIVQYEMRYTYPSRGERELFITYFPIDGPGGVDRVASVLHDITDRKQAERSLTLFRTLIDQSNDAVEVVDPETLRFLDVNEKTCKDLGYTREELLSMTVFDINPLLNESIRTKVMMKLHESGCFIREGVHRRKDGSTFPVETSMKFIQLGRSYVVAVSRDITARKRAETTLQSSEQRYRMLFEKNVAGVVISTLEGIMLDCNDAWAQMLGYGSAEEIRGHKTGDFYFDLSEREPIMDQLRGELALVGGELRLRRKDGSPVWVLFQTTLLENEAGSVIQGTAIDITERKQAEDAMRQNEERFRVALKDSPITVFNQDRDLRYTWIYNPVHWQREVIGKTDEEIIGPVRAARLVELKRRVLSTGLTSRQEVVIADEGKNYAFDMTVEPLRDAEGNIIGITGSLMDVARLREIADGLQAARDKLAREKSYLESEIQAELGFEEIIGQSSALRAVLRKARIVAPTDSSVLLLGETGTGKDLVARSVHSLSSRHERNFIKLNCAAVPSGLLESELFGHEKGAFTGAVSQKVGRIELADKGTLFLDEIGELPLELQPKLLRVLQDREFERLGGVRTLHVDVRVISATNCDLHQYIVERKFREDLFYRLNVFPIQLPSLRERRSDIPILVQHFVRKHSVRMGKRIDAIPDETMEILQGWTWPGNIRELENMIERMVILTKGGTLIAPPVELAIPRDATEDNLTEMEREHILRVLRETKGVLSGPDGAASRLGIKRTTLQSMLKRFGIEPHVFRRGTGTYGGE
jgi:formate hydrogenlyase transcriptional activator